MISDHALQVLELVLGFYVHDFLLFNLHITESKEMETSKQADELPRQTPDHLESYAAALSKLQTALRDHDIHVPVISGIEVSTVDNGSALAQLGLPTGAVVVIKGDIYVSLLTGSE